MQTHGHSSEEFLLDGPSGVTTAFAAQPLAGVGFLVLQLGGIGAEMTNDEPRGQERRRRLESCYR